MNVIPVTIAACRALPAALAALVLYGCGGSAADASRSPLDVNDSAPPFSVDDQVQPRADSTTAPVSTGPITPMVAAADGTSFVLTSAGTVFGWGNQLNGRLGDGEIGDRSRTQPAPLLGLRGIKQIAVGDAHGLALHSDGFVFVWGANGAGQLGNGQEGGSFGTPFRLATLSQVVAVAAGGDFSMALGANGRVYTWGDNVAGQLGQGDDRGRTQPTQLPDLQDVAIIGAGAQHALAVRRDGAVFAWGNNQDGQLGLAGSLEGDVPHTPRPRRIIALDRQRVTAVDGGRFHTVILMDDGSVRAFGASNVGQAGSDSDIDHFDSYRSPIRLNGVSEATAVAAGNEHTLLLTRAGITLAVGHAGEGRLGDGRDGRSQSSSLPAPADVSDVLAIAAGARHSLIIDHNGTVGCFGSNFLGQCGQSQGFTEIVTPVAVPGVNALR